MIGMNGRSSAPLMRREISYPSMSGSMTSSRIRSGGVAHQRQRLLAVARLQDLVAAEAQPRRDDLDVVLVVIHHQDAARLGGRLRTFFAHVCSSRR
jgi:hypothetical protein